MIKTFVEYRDSVTGKLFTTQDFDDENSKDGRWTLEYNRYISKNAKVLKKESDIQIEKREFVFNAVNKLGEEKFLSCFMKYSKGKDVMSGISGYNSIEKSEIEYMLTTV